jgi:xylan 1,4-beta-xylosidase
MPTFTCDLLQESIPFEHVWEHTVGSDHAPIALRADWQAQLRTCHTELGFEHVRFHGLLSDEMGTLICQQETLRYSFFNADQIIDFLLSIGMRPFVELSFMPETLASGPTTVFRYRGNVTPPRDYVQWAILIRKLIEHWIERYGIGEVSRWYFEVWNEPNLATFWTGTQRDYFTLYRYTAEAIKRVDASLRVGGPATAQTAWIAEFLDFCQQHNVPADFVTTHYYPTDAFGQIGADTETQLANAPRDVMREQAQQARRQAGGRPLFYTEWNISSNPRDPLHDLSFAAAYATRIIMGVASLVQGYSFWTCSDIFAENYFPSETFHGGFGLLNLQAIAKPVYRAFELLHHLGTERLPVKGSHGTVDAWAVRKGRSLTMLITNHAQPRQPIATEPVSLSLINAPAPQGAYVERIDDAHANPHQLWTEMGEPTYLTSSEVKQLKEASRLVKEPIACTCEAGTVHFDIDLPPHGVAAITIEILADLPGGTRGSGRTTP